MSLWGAMEANQAALRLHELELRLHVDEASTSTRLGPLDHHADASPKDGAIVHYAASKCRRWKDVIPAHDSDAVVVPELRLVYVDNVKVGSTTIRNALATVGYTWFIKRECAQPIPRGPSASTLQTDGCFWGGGHAQQLSRHSPR